MPKHILWAEGIRTMDCVHFGLSCCLRLAQMFAICCCHRWRWEISNKYYFQSWLHIVLVLIFIFERILCQLSLWRAFQVFAKALDCKHFFFIFDIQVFVGSPIESRVFITSENMFVFTHSATNLFSNQKTASNVTSWESAVFD